MVSTWMEITGPHTAKWMCGLLCTSGMLMTNLPIINSLVLSDFRHFGYQIQNKVLGIKVFVTQIFILLCSFVLVLWHTVPNLPQMDVWIVNKFDTFLT
jgi:hypothetical protein